MPDRSTMDCIAAATAECGMRAIANWFPADRHDELREMLCDLAVGALCAFAGAEVWAVPEPSDN